MARHDASAFTVGLKGYFATGYNGGVAYKDLWEWDQPTDFWTQKADLPGPARYGSFAFEINGKGYLGTGWTFSGNQLNDFYEYNPTTNSWTQKADFAGGVRYDAVGLSNGVNGYVGFGYSPNYNDWWEYDPGINVWTAKSNFPGLPRQSLAGFTIGSDVYVGTGSTFMGFLFNDLWKYTTATNSWTQMADFPGVARYATIGFTINGEGFIGSGGNGLGTFYQDFYKYHPGSNSWSPIAPWPAAARYAGDGFSMGVNGYAGLGEGAGNIYYSDFWEYSPDGPVINFNSAQQYLCPGTCTDFYNLTPNAISSQWYFPGATPNASIDSDPTNICYLTPGSYDVTLIATDSIGTDTLTIQNFITLFPYASPQYITQIGDTLISIFGSTSYQWFYNGSIINGATNYYYVPVASGNFSVVATDSNGCEVEAVVVDVIASNQEIDESTSAEMVIYPNPYHSTSDIFLSSKKGADRVTLEIYNSSAQRIELLFDGQLHAGETRKIEFHPGEIPGGVYFYRIKNGTEVINGRLLLIK